MRGATSKEIDVVAGLSRETPDGPVDRVPRVRRGIVGRARIV